MRFKGPFRDPVKNAWWNITFCGALVIGLGISAFNHGAEQPQLWLFVVGAIAGEGVFVYSLFKARRDVE